MITEKALHEHLFACEQTYHLLLDENRMLKTTAAPPGDDFLEQKRVALRQLDSALAALRALGVHIADLTPQHRAIIQKTQQIVLKTLLLDRENEQRLYRKHALTQDPAA